VSGKKVPNVTPYLNHVVTLYVVMYRGAILLQVRTFTGRRRRRSIVNHINTYFMLLLFFFYY